MKSASVGQLGLSLLGVYALVHGLMLFPWLGALASILFEHQRAPIVVLVTFVPFALVAVLGVILVTEPAKVARWIWPGAAGIDSLRVTGEVPTLLLAIAGILVFAGALPDLVSATVRYLGTGGAEGPAPDWLVGHLVRVCLGLFLFFRPVAVLRFWRRQQPPVDTEAA